MIAGVGVVGYALLGTEAPYFSLRKPGQENATATLIGLVVFTAVGAAGWAALVSWRMSTGRARGLPPGWLVGPVTALLAVGALSIADWWSFASGSFPGDRPLLVVAAHGALLIGMALIIAASARMPSTRAIPRLWSRAGIAGLISGATAAALAMGGVVAIGGDHNRIDATTAVAVQQPPMPTDAMQVAWRWWDGSDGSATVVAAGAGVVVATDRGVYGLDGRTGEERWHYRRTDADPDALLAVDGGRSVVVLFDRRLHAFDAFTGELRWRDKPSLLHNQRRQVIAAGGSTVIYELPWRTIVGIDAGTGTPRWEYSPSTGLECHWKGADIIANALVIAGSDCVDDGKYGIDGIFALDATTGQLLWQKEHKSVGNYDSVRIYNGVIYEADNLALMDPRSRLLVQVPISNALAWAIGSGEIVSFDASPGWGKRRPVTLTKVGEAAPRWQVLDMSDDAVAGVAALGDVVVILDESLCSDGGIWVLNRSDGTERRRLVCDSVPHSVLDGGTAVVPVPGALVVRGERELVGIR